MKTIIAGSRSIKDSALLGLAIEESGFKITEVVSGTARGVDQMGEEWAEENGIPIKKFPPNWEKYGKKASYIRNEQMANYASALIAVWDGKSKGTKHMIETALLKNLKVFVMRSDVGPIITEEEFLGKQSWDDQENLWK